ncbi:hypothetical protein QR680_009192 [Steinernema hermaphroditum]|uniref:Vesicle-fusing ATPase n=1 Tax=Steinernema hermaphroditum TaxID=289476 RepID=A0AA39ILT0_9BILA|nr:hypothetical protein QR680_009192 [Steinernema hermaphroditum]
MCCPCGSFIRLLLIERYMENKAQIAEPAVLLNTDDSIPNMSLLKVSKCPTDELAITNCAVVNRADFDASRVKHVEIKHVVSGPPHSYIFTIKNHPNVNPGEIAFSTPQRGWAALSLAQQVRVLPYTFSSDEYIATITIIVDFRLKKQVVTEPFDSDNMAKEFSMQFSGQAFTVNQSLVFKYFDPKTQKDAILSATVKEMQGTDINSLANDSGGKSGMEKISQGCLLSNAPVIFEKAEGSQMNLIGKSKGKTAHRALINPDWNFQKMGIGGLDKEFSTIFRRAFASRLFPPEFIEQLGMKHVRGILLFGPPGTGKTLIARQIGKMLNAREPKIVNGPEILNKYVGESEGNIRKLFAEAEEEWKRCGGNSALHMIIFDEIDAICKQRGSMAGSSGVNDTVVNQLLSKMDGVEQLNNILVIGMTNRRDMIDEALLRPGRMEVQMEISLPDEDGRMQILKIHTERMREFGLLDRTVDLRSIAKRTPNFSGAEIEGLVRAAESSAMNRMVKTGSSVSVDNDAHEKLRVTCEDFDYAIENEVKPAFGQIDEHLDRFEESGFYYWGNEISRIVENAKLYTPKDESQYTIPLQCVLFLGAIGSGTSTIASKVAKESDVPFVRLCSAADMAGCTEAAKCMKIRNIFEDAYKSPKSVIVVDDLEGLIDYTPIGPRFSQLILGTLTQLMKRKPPKGHQLTVLATSSEKNFVDLFRLREKFSKAFEVPSLDKVEYILSVAEESAILSEAELEEFRVKLLSTNDKYCVGMKQLMKSLCMSRYVTPESIVDYVIENLRSESAGAAPAERDPYLF